MSRGKTRRMLTRLRPTFLALLLSSVGLVVVMSLGASGCAQDSVTVGAPPAADAEMKSVVINIFGMT